MVTAWLNSPACCQQKYWRPSSPCLAIQSPDGRSSCRCGAWAVTRLAAPEIGAGIHLREPSLRDMFPGQLLFHGHNVVGQGFLGVGKLTGKRCVHSRGQALDLGEAAIDGRPRAAAFEELREVARIELALLPPPNSSIPG